MSCLLHPGGQWPKWPFAEPGNVTITSCLSVSEQRQCHWGASIAGSIHLLHTVPVAVVLFRTGMLFVRTYLSHFRRG